MIQFALAFANLVSQTDIVFNRVSDGYYSISYPITMNVSNYVWSVQTSETIPPVWKNEPFIEFDGQDVWVHGYGRPKLYVRLVGTLK